MQRRYLLAAFALAVLVGAVVLIQNVGADEQTDESGVASVQVARAPFVRTLRLTGLIESVRYHNVAAPRLVGVSGPGSNTLIITKITRGGSQVAKGDLLVEFDRQNQLKAAFDKRAEYLDFEEQIRKKRAEQERTRATDDAELAVAAHAVDSA